MKVCELMELLATCDAEAEVVLTNQPHYPLEHAVAGVVIRSEYRGKSGDNSDWDDAGPRDVLLIEGRWLRYGERAAWDRARPGRR